MTDVIDATHPRQDLAGRAISGAAWLVVEMGGTQGLSLIFFMVLAHFVTPRDFGLITIAYVAVQSFRLIVQDGIPNAIAIKATAVAADWNTAFWISAGAGVLSALLLLAASGTLARIFAAPELGPVIRAMSAIVLFCGISRTHELWLIRNFQFRSLALRGIGGSLAGGVAGILWVKQGGVYALVLQQVVGSLVSLVLLWTRCPWRPGFHTSAKAARDIAAFVRDTSAGGVITFVNQSFDTVLVAFAFGPSAAGLYNIAKRLRLALQLVTSSPISNVILPTMAEAKLNPERARRIFERALSGVSLFCSPAAFGAMLVSSEVVVLFFGHEWAAAAPIFAALAAGVLGQTLNSCAMAVFVTHARPRWTVYFSLLETGMAVGCVVVLAPTLGTLGVGIASVAPLLLTVPLAAALATRLLGLTLGDWSRMVLPGVASAGVMVAITLPVYLFAGDLSNAARLTLISALGIAIYALVLRIINKDAFVLGAGVARSLLPRRRRIVS